jgi:hypothetical protein
VVEQLFRKQQVTGSNPVIGFSSLNLAPAPATFPGSFDFAFSDIRKSGSRTKHALHKQSRWLLAWIAYAGRWRQHFDRLEACPLEHCCCAWVQSAGHSSHQSR